MAKTLTTGQQIKKAYWKAISINKFQYSKLFTNYSICPNLSDIIPKHKQKENITGKTLYFRSIDILQNMDYDNFISFPLINPKEKPVLWQQDNNQYKTINKKETILRNITPEIVLKILRQQGKISKNTYNKAIRHNIISKDTKRLISCYYGTIKAKTGKTSISALQRQSPKPFYKVYKDNLAYKVTIKKVYAQRLTNYNQPIKKGSLGTIQKLNRTNQIYSDIDFEGVTRYKAYNQLLFDDIGKN